MRVKFNLLFFLCMLTIGMLAQDDVHITDEISTETETESMALNLDNTEFENTENSHTSLYSDLNIPDLVVSIIQAKQDLSFAVTASSNQDEENILLVIDEFDGLNYKLTDLDGRILDAMQIVSVETPIEFVHFIPSEYYIEIFSDDELLKTFKVIKR